MTHTHSSTTTTTPTAMPVVTPATSPTASGFPAAQDEANYVRTIYDAFSAPGSPTQEQFVYDGDWEDYCNISVFNDDDGFALAANVNAVESFCNTGNITSLDPETGNVVSYNPITEEYRMPTFEELLNWYRESLAEGHWDNVSLVGTPLGSPSLRPVDIPCIDPALLWETIAAVNKLSDAPEDHHDADGIMSERASLAPAGIMDPLSLSIDNSDLNNIGCMLAQDEDSVSTSNSTTSDDEDDGDYLEPEDIVRHHWYRNDGIKYTFVFGGKRYYMSAEAMAAKFGGVRFSLWHYWHDKKAGRVPYGRLIAHLRTHGCSGFFREMIIHLLPRWLQRLLYAARKNGTLDSFVIPEHDPKGRNSKKK